MAQPVKRQAANLAVVLKKTTYRRILSNCRAPSPAETAQRIDMEMYNYPQLAKILRQSSYYGDGTYLPLMRLVSLL